MLNTTAHNILDVVARHDMLGGARLVVLMVSGGSDSMALAHLLPQLCSGPEYVLLHVNHNLRAEEAQGDECFAVQYAQKAGLSCHVEQVDVAALAAAEGLNVEDAGRRARYAAANALLDRLCAERSLDRGQGRIATAHTLDDRAETFLMRTIVGAGAAGLSSVPYVNGRVVRPLLCCTRAELRKELNTAGITWREDATNLDTAHLRAYVRHEVLPELTIKNPDILHTLGRSMDVLGEEDAYLSKLASAFVPIEEPGGVVALSDAALNTDLALRRRVVREACLRVVPEGQRVGFEHIDLIARRGHDVGFVTDIPGGACVRNEYGRLVFIPSGGRKVTGVGQATLVVDGDALRLADGRVLEARTIKVGEAVANGDVSGFVRAHSTPGCVYVDADLLGSTVLEVTGVRPADRFEPLGLGGHSQLVSDLLIDRKVPARLRQQVAVVRLAGRIVWIVGIRMSEAYKVSAKSTTMVCLRCTPANGQVALLADPRTRSGM